MADNIVKVFGHKAPDTDATCTAIIYAWCLNNLHGIEAKPYVLGDLNKETEFVLERFGFSAPERIDAVGPGEPVVIVDTNNPKELPEGIEEADVREIIDHHKLAGLNTAKPVHATIRPLASTASVIFTLIEDKIHEVEDDILGLMCSCILSDTLEFRSPTTTELDKDICLQLAEKIGLNLSDHAEEMFAAKSDVSHLSETELLRLDSKIYEINGVKMRVAVMETTAPEVILARKDAIMDAQKAVALEEGLDEVPFFIIDIMNEEATMLIATDRMKEIAEKAFDIKADGDMMKLPGVVSRKKQIIPALER